MLNINQYRKAIHLDQEIEIRSSLPTTDKNSLVDNILSEFINKELQSSIPSEYDQKRALLQSFVTSWNPGDLSLSDTFKMNLDQLLQLELKEKKITTVSSLSNIKDIYRDTLYPAANNAILWKGDITTLQADAITNAANAQMLGCFQPFHKCIDNAIHCASGVQLREDCYTIMKMQNQLENTGNAKITRAYNLPSRFVLHTVGPIVKNHTPTTLQKQDLANCYLSCLTLAKEFNLRTVAFCSISTGVFGYPVEEAARIALETVSNWLTKNTTRIDSVIFNVFSDRDEAVYKNILLNWNKING